MDNWHLGGSEMDFATYSIDWLVIANEPSTASLAKS